MSEEKQQSFKYQVARNVSPHTELFGLTGKRVLILLPFLAIAVLLFFIFSGPPRVVLPLIILGVSYFGVTKSIDGETPFELLEIHFKDMFNPRIHLWEEPNHARLYEREKTE